MEITDLYQTKITCNTYNADIGSKNTVITVKLIDFNGNAVTNKSVTLTCDKGYFNKKGTTDISGTSTKSITVTTDNNGEITATWTASEWGLATFSVNNQKVQVNVTGYKLINTVDGGDGKVVYSFYVDDANRTAKLKVIVEGATLVIGDNRLVNYEKKIITNEKYYPQTSKFSLIGRHLNSAFYLWGTGVGGIANLTNSQLTNHSGSCEINWSY